MLAVLGDDFIRTARAERLPARRIYARHALPNALTATLTMGGLVATFGAGARFEVSRGSITPSSIRMYEE